MEENQYEQPVFSVELVKMIYCAMKDKTMPKPKRLTSGKSQKKQKLTPAERSQIAKDRWAKIRVAKEPTPMYVVSDELRDLHLEIAANATAKIVEQANASAPPPVEQEAPAPSELEVSGLQVKVEAGGGKTLAAASQLTPIAPKKPKRIPQPKEFSVALKAAESRLAKAITERAEYAGKLAALQAEIPSLMQIIQALGGSRQALLTASQPMNFDFSGSVPNATAFQSPMAPQFQPPYDPLAAIQSAAPLPPVSKASGGAMQFGPEVFGELEGPEDDVDKFISGPAAGSKGWI
jgi:hypothetical protein